MDCQAMQGLAGHLVITDEFVLQTFALIIQSMSTEVFVSTSSSCPPVGLSISILFTVMMVCKKHALPVAYKPKEALS